MRSLLLAAALLGAACVASFAAAVTYSGTRGDDKIILELTEAEDGPIVGRYTLLSDGADVPLHFIQFGKDGFELAEEKRCTPEICAGSEDDNEHGAPLGGRWILHYTADHSALTGFWRPDETSSIQADVKLTRMGQRVYDREDQPFAFEFFLWSNSDGAPLSPETSPYDFAKMQVPLTEGALQTENGASYHEVIDPRTKFPFPRVVALPGGGDIGPINAVLDQQRWSINLSGFDCLGKQYWSGGWDPQRAGDGYSALGDIDLESISVAYLSDTVMTITQGGSTSCGGASPYNHGDTYTYDVRLGRPVELSQIFAGWSKHEKGPTAALADWVRKTYAADPGYDAAFDTDCEVSQNVAEHLDIGFAEGDVAVFVIGEIGQAACSGEFLRRPLADIRNLLSDKAVDYFPSLKD